VALIEKSADTSLENVLAVLLNLARAKLDQTQLRLVEMEILYQEESIAIVQAQLTDLCMGS